ENEHGDILAFLPGTEEIRRCTAHIKEELKHNAINILPLSGDLPKTVQDQTVRYLPGGERRLILSTAIAETSLTIEGVRVVIDSGWSRISRFDPNSGLSKLVTVRVSQAAAEQRRGRAGRVCEGICYRLWNESENSTLPTHGRPEILDADLAPLTLDLAAWGVASPTSLRWLDPPPSGHYAAAADLLILLDGLDNQRRITPLGHRMSRLPVHPRLARMILAAGNSVSMACDIAALLTERDILPRNRSISTMTPRSIDIDTRIQALATFRLRDKTTALALGADLGACARVDAAAKQLHRLLPDPQRPNRQPNDHTTAGELLTLAYPDRIAQLRPGGHTHYRLATGRGVRLPEDDSLCGSPYLVAATLDAGQTEGRVYLAAQVSIDAIRQRLNDHITTDDAVYWDVAQEAVVSCHQERLLSLVLDERPLSSSPREATRSALSEGIRKLGLSVLPWTKEAITFRARVESLRYWQPDQGWPNLSDDTLIADLYWLSPYLDHMSRKQHLARLNLLTIFQGLLDWNQLQRLNAEAPTHIEAPSGSRLPLRYIPGEAPILAVRLQEMFGLSETPKVARGQIAVTLHLLSPAQRPIQITQDLSGFWNTTYPEVKKELKGRYPKHVWPDDPWEAKATARAQPRKKS
ncbi:MAG: ATP-dependent helicase HrpB, partial [Desulfobulbaceae bacterium]|nr:ATP-dependent helicase HrpB [Desulfobulbaceae bacterium]